MSIRWRTILIISLAFIVIISLTTLYTNSVIFKTNRIIEDKEVRSKAKLVLRVLNNEIESIDTVCKDWAYWDDSYKFVADRNEEYIKSNLVNETFIDLKLNMIVFVDMNKHIVYAKAYDWINNRPIDVPDGLINFVKSIKREEKGIIDLGRPMLISVRYILPSNETGTPRGYLIFGRFLDEWTLNKISKITGIAVKLTSPTHNLKYVRENGNLRVFVPINDLNGHTVADLSFEVYPFWEKLSNYIDFNLIFSITVSTLLVGLAVLYLVNTDLRRLLSLKKFVNEAKEDLQKRFETEGNDEISELAKGINSMLDRIALLNDGLKFTNKLLRHDILNKLSIIIGYGEIGKVEENVKYFDKITHVAEDAATLIARIRDLEKAFVDFKAKKIDLKDVLRKVIENYNVEWSLKGDGCILADNGIYSIIDNIVQNAVKHGKTKRIDFEIKELDDKTELRIKDYGEGIPDEMKSKIFEEGFSTGGSGIGLYIVKKLVEIYNGSIYVEDNHPRGAMFILTFPKC